MLIWKRKCRSGAKGCGSEGVVVVIITAVVVMVLVIGTSGPGLDLGRVVVDI